LSPRRVEPGPPSERTYWELLPRRNFRRALLLLAALIAVVVIRQMGGFSFSKLFDQIGDPGRVPAPSRDVSRRAEPAGTRRDSVAPPVTPASPEQRPFQHLEVKR